MISVGHKVLTHARYSKLKHIMHDFFCGGGGGTCPSPPPPVAMPLFTFFFSINAIMLFYMLHIYSLF